MIKNPFAGFDFSNPFGSDAMKRSRNLFGVHTTPRDWKHGARDIPFGMGAASLHVDGTDGDDSNDGESWITAKKTIQEAVDAASHWTNIFIKPGAYAESVHIDTKHGIALLGATRAGVHITAPDGGNAYTSSSISFGDALSGYVANLKLTAGDDYYGVYGANADLLRVENCYCYNCESGVKLYNSDDVIIYNNLIDGANRDVGAHGGIFIDANSSRCHAFKNTISNYTGTGSGALILGEDCRLHDNTITSVYYGILIQAALSVATIFHNNLITCSSKYIYDLSTNATVFENYYSAHSNVDNGFGIAKAPYAYTGGTDPRPVVCRNGWLGLSWADADLVADILADVTGIAGAAMRGTDNAALASALTTHDGKLDTVDGIVDAILADTTGLNGDAMRGTNSAALASVCTGTRLAELDAANLPTDIDAILADVTGIAGAAMRGTDNAALASVCTEARLARLTKDVTVGIKKGVARTIMFKMVDATDFATPEPDIDVTEEISKDGGAFVACDNADAQISDGWYKIVLTATEMNANEIIFKGTAAGCAQCDRLLITES